MRNHTFLIWLSIATLCVLIWLFSPFLKSLGVALLLALTMAPLQQLIAHSMTKYTFSASQRDLFAASLITLFLALMIFLPMSLFFFQLFKHPTTIMETIRSFDSQIHLDVNLLPAYLEWAKEPFETLIMLTNMHKDEIIALLSKWLGSGLKTFLKMLSEMVMIIVFFFFFNLYGRSLFLFLMPIIPLARTIKRQFISEMTITLCVVFYTLLGVIVAQGLAFGLFIAFFDGYNALLLGFLAGISSIIPIVGTALVWVPVAISEYWQGEVMNAVVIAIYSWAMMAFFIDNIVKLLILNYVNRSMNGGEVRTNEFIIFFSIVAGLGAFGFWGFIIGPALVALAISVLKTLRKIHYIRS
ncbi:AI-2E family transporter [Sulfurospirillum barnesii]|uniref:Putative permease n=1 Tax=Sulfurospirillum barnesii (strain ATCC 700032 / DSM 10660 / SES-3) TaxID=760154 RepID=I3XWJ4_SULBS|nr:AI-2E family transporter [Sulfurospirillum barnesii]AFL68318.1 putative permease [Sulfurospirillum barnesii SES-3]